MRALLVSAWLGLVAAAAVPLSASADVSFSIGIDVPVYPDLVPVPGYPVYYAPRLGYNYFFYDGLYWVFGDDGNWYEANWYNGPWYLVPPDDVPVYVLNVPLRYYYRPPAFFRGWALNAAPPWERHWGHDWGVRHRGWDHWDRRAAPAPAPLPHWQRDYRGERYPQRPQDQAQLYGRNYNYTPRDPAARQRWEQHQNWREHPESRRDIAPGPVQRQPAPIERVPRSGPMPGSSGQNDRG